MLIRFFFSFVDENNYLELILVFFLSHLDNIILFSAPDFKTVQNKVSKLLKGQVLVGHALKNDLKVGCSKFFPYNISYNI